MMMTVSSSSAATWTLMQSAMQNLNELLMMLAQSSAENQTAVKTLADMLAEQIKVVNALAEDSAVIKNSMKEMSVTFKGLSNVFFEEINTSSKRIDKVEKDSMGIGQVEKLVRRQFVEFSKNLGSWIVNAVRRTMDSEKAKAKDHDEDSDPEATEFFKRTGWRRSEMLAYCCYPRVLFR